jgi:hypothetical protein
VAGCCRQQPVEPAAAGARLIQNGAIRRRRSITGPPALRSVEGQRSAPTQPWRPPQRTTELPRTGWWEAPGPQPKLPRSGLGGASKLAHTGSAPRAVITNEFISPIGPSAETLWSATCKQTNGTGSGQWNQRRGSPHFGENAKILVATSCGH